MPVISRRHPTWTMPSISPSISNASSNSSNPKQLPRTPHLDTYLPITLLPPSPPLTSKWVQDLYPGTYGLQYEGRSGCHSAICQSCRRQGCLVHRHRRCQGHQGHAGGARLSLWLTGKARIVQIDNLEESIAIGHGRRCGIIPAQEDQSDAWGQELVSSEQSCFK